jgi:hypothetical protein
MININFNINIKQNHKIKRKKIICLICIFFILILRSINAYSKNKFILNIYLILIKSSINQV